MKTKLATICGTLGRSDSVEVPKREPVNTMVVIASGKGGVGKSTLSANLGIALGQMNQQVCLFDADTNLANINILFGINPRQTLREYLSGERRIEEILLSVSERLNIVPAASGIAEFLELSSQQQERLLDGLRHIEQQNDVILVDSAAGVGSGQLGFFLAAVCPVLVITPEPTSLTDAFSFLKMAKRYGFSGTVYVVINQATDLHAARSAFKRFRKATEKYLQLPVGYLGYVLQDQQVQLSVRKQQPVLLGKPECLASRCIRVIAERLIRLLQNQRGGAETFSHYLKEMNQPFGIALPQVAEDASAQLTTTQVAAWQAQVLERLGELDQGESKAFIRRAVSEWMTRYDADEAALFDDRESPQLQVPNDQHGSAGSAETLHNSGQERPQRHQFKEALAGSPYTAAAQFAELLARIEAK